MTSLGVHGKPPALPPAIAALVDDLAGLPGVRAVALGGSRADDTAGPGSDWDIGVYYRNGFDPADVRELGVVGLDPNSTVTDLGTWGGGVFNGGAWLEVGGHRVDLLWRDLAVVEHEMAEAARGHWRTEPLMFHLVGIPTYLILAELAKNRVLRGVLPRPDYPDALRSAAGEGWRGRAEGNLDFASRHHAARGAVTACLGLTAIATAEYAHAVAAASGTWVTNDKRLLQLGGVDAVDALIADLPGRPDPARLQRLVAEVQAVGRAAWAEAFA